MAASVSSFILGLAVFAVYQMHRARRKAQAEVAFEAALQDSGLGLDDAFEQVSLCWPAWDQTVGTIVATASRKLMAQAFFHNAEICMS